MFASNINFASRASLRSRPLVNRSRQLALAAAAAAAIVCGAASSARAGEIRASGVKDTKMDNDTYRWSDPGAGQILVETRVKGAGVRSYIDAANPQRTGAPGNIDTGNFITGVRNATGVAKPKSLTVVSGDKWGTELKENGTNIISHGDGEWTSTPTPGVFGTNIKVNYRATTSIKPLPQPFNAFGPYITYCEVSDPLTLTSLSMGDAFRVQDTLTSFAIDLSGVSGPGAEGVLVSDLQLDGEDLYSLTVHVPSDFDDPDDVTVRYLDRDGLRDTGMESMIHGALTISPGSQIVSFDGQLEVFPLESFSGLAVGDHTLGGRLMTGVSVPEPASLTMVGVAGAALLRRRRRA